MHKIYSSQQRTPQSLFYSSERLVVRGEQHTCRFAYSICMCMMYSCVCQGTVSTGEAETWGRFLWGPFWGAGERLGIGYSQNYFHMVQRPLVMSCTVVAWLPPSQHHPFNPRLSGETMGNIQLVRVNKYVNDSCRFKPA